MWEIPGLWSQTQLGQALLVGSGVMRQAPQLRPLPSVPPGEILVQMSDTQRHLNSDLEVVVSLRSCGPERSVGRVGGVPWRTRAKPPHPFSERTLVT